MRTRVLAVVLASICVACSTPNELNIPPLPSPPSQWGNFSTSTVPGSECPIIGGAYLDSPLIYRLGVDADLIPRDSSDLYSRYIPFHLAERVELAANEMSLSSSNFAIRQPDATQFYFSYFNEPTSSLVQYHFQSEKGDFECRNGYIEFPKIARYGVIEGVSVNYQIKNILLKDEEGALVIQSAGGPYRGKASKSGKGFMFEFFKYFPKLEDESRGHQ